MTNPRASKAYLRAYIRNEVGKWLKNHRERNQFSLEQVSLMMPGFTVQDIQDIELGESPLLMSRFSAFIKVYDIDVSESIELFYRLNAYIEDSL